MTANVRHHYRVTKYDPAYRDGSGAYTRDEWTIHTEIGDIIGGHLVTEDEVVETINKYLYAFEAFANESNVTTSIVCRRGQRDRSLGGAGDRVTGSGELERALIKVFVAGIRS